jgi:hypothetical protein
MFFPNPGTPLPPDAGVFKTELGINLISGKKNLLFNPAGKADAIVHLPFV